MDATTYYGRGHRDGYYGRTPKTEETDYAKGYEEGAARRERFEAPKEAGTRIEAKQDALKRLDPMKEEHLSEMFTDYVASVYVDPSTSRERKNEEVQEAEAIYERALDEALAEHKAEFFKAWEAVAEEARDSIYEYMQPEFKAWLDEREEGRA